MENNGKRTGVVATVVAILLLILIVSCSAEQSNDDYRRILESGQRKYYTGEKMTKEEYNAVKGFNDWKSKQGPKTYSDWSN